MKTTGGPIGPDIPHRCAPLLPLPMAREGTAVPMCDSWLLQLMFKLDPEVLAAGGQNLAPQRAYWKPLIAANASVIVVLFTLTKW